MRIAGESRTSTIVVDPTTMTQTEIIEYGPIVSEPELAELLERIDYLAKGANAVVLAGSLPRKVPEDFYATVMQRLRKRHCFIVLDSYGEPLRYGVRGKPHLVTPNIREAEDLVGHEFHDEQDVADATAAICEMGARNVIVKTTFGCIARFKTGAPLPRVPGRARRRLRTWSARSVPATPSSPASSTRATPSSTSPSASAPGSARPAPTRSNWAPACSTRPGAPPGGRRRGRRARRRRRGG